MKVDEEFERKEHFGKGAGRGRLAVVEVAGSMGSMELLGRQLLARPLKVNSVLVHRVQLIPPRDDERVEDGSRIFGGEWGVNAHNEGRKSDEQYSPHCAFLSC